LITLTHDQTLQRSTDGGMTWKRFNVPGWQYFYPVPSPVVGSPIDSRSWYVTSTSGPGMVTTDGGETWKSIKEDGGLIAFGAVPGLMYAQKFGIWAGSGGGGNPAKGLQVSFDNGATWRDTATFPEVISLSGIVPSPSDARIVYAYGSSDVLRSDDQGATWTASTAPFALPPFNNALAVDSVDPNVLYAAYYGRAQESVWSSLDAGKTWTPSPLKWIVNVVADPLERGRAYAFSYGGNVYETRDSGKTWVAAEGNSATELDPAMTPTGVAGPLMAAVANNSGRRTGVKPAGASGVFSVGLTDGALALGSDLWWNPAESGAGFTITQHASTNPFIVWYTYDVTGAPVWRVVPGGKWTDRTFTGTLYETTGPAYFLGAFDSSRVASRAVGTATLRFDDENNAVITATTTGGASGEKRITRQIFGGDTPRDSYADLWWNGSESGWGIGINHQGNRIFATWYVYGDDGKPLWVVMPDSVLTTEFVGVIAGQSATGDIYTTRGPAAGTPFDPSKVLSTKVGSAKLLFRSLNDGTLEYTAFGRTETRAITRQPF
jgi:photosystem II stability/assembly factor-like uncharacterized protein